MFLLNYVQNVIDVQHRHPCTSEFAGTADPSASDLPAYYAEGSDMVPSASPSVVSGPPLEEHLSQNTLWPEVHKLYGHGNEVFCMSASPDGRFVASACKAQTSAAAEIWVWETKKWQAVAQLQVGGQSSTDIRKDTLGRMERRSAKR